MNTTLAVAQGNNGYAVVETWHCPKCGLFQFHIHEGNMETLPCCQCKAMTASRFPRKAVAGEVTANHFEFVIQSLQFQYAELSSLLPPLAQGEIEQFDPALKHILNRYGNQVAFKTVMFVKKFAESAAGAIG